MKFLIQKLKTDKGQSRFYLRLEKDGVFEGWAIPKGLPDEAGKMHLALKVGPFPLESEDFEGRVGEGKFPPGMISVWERGKVLSRQESDKKIIVKLFGTRVQGTYALIRFEKAGSDGWLIGRSEERKNPKQIKKRKSASERKRAIWKQKSAGSKEKRSSHPGSSVQGKAPDSNLSQRSRPQEASQIKQTHPPKKHSSRQKYRTWKKQNRTRTRSTIWLTKSRQTKEGRLTGWIYMGLIILIIYGIIQLIKYIGTLF